MLSVQKYVAIQDGSMIATERLNTNKGYLVHLLY